MNCITIIDDGIHDKLFKNTELIGNYEILHDLTVRQREEYDPYSNSHGTICAAIIQKIVPAAKIISIKITNGSTKRSTKEQLLKALKWCGEHRVPLVNLSMGTIDYRDFAELIEAVNEITRIGTILVAAFHNYNIYTCPASLPNVFGVCHAKGLFTEKQFAFYNDSAFLSDNCIIANSNFQLEDSFGKTHFTGISNSFAAPLITSVISQIINENSELDFCGIKRELLRESVTVNMETLTHSWPIRRISSEGTTHKPFIAICYNEGFLGNQLSSKLASCFQSEGYAPLVFSDNDQEIQKSSAVIPIQHYYRMYEQTISFNTLLILEQIYDADVFILSLNSKELPKLEKMQLDIIITQIQSDSLNCYAFKDIRHKQIKLIRSVRELYTNVVNFYKV
jgi:hypothetical protein